MFSLFSKKNFAYLKFSIKKLSLYNCNEGNDILMLGATGV